MKDDSEGIKTLSANFLAAVKDISRDLGFDAVNSFHYWRHNLSGNKVQKRYFSGKSKHPSVILLQGFMGTRGVLKPLEDFLRANDRDVISLDLGFFNIGDIRKSSQLLSYKIERIVDRFYEKHSFEKIDIIGHSMGGLIGLYYVKRLGGHRLVRNLITLGAPFSGTWTSLLGIFPFGLVAKGVWQMMPGSTFLKNLQADPLEAHETKTISIAAKYDTICPPKTCHLKGAVNHVIPVGHASLLMDDRVFNATLSFLDNSQAAANHLKVVSLSKK
jgi:triacylglycerol lipase